MLDDRELWTKISVGDAQAFDGWYREQAPRLLVFLRHVLGNAQAADDAMQETFTQIWRRPHGYDPERGALRGWLFGIARKQAAEWVRKHKPADPLEGNEVEGDEGRPERVEASSVMSDALGRLPAEQRTLLWLREVEGQSYGELAASASHPSACLVAEGWGVPGAASRSEF